MYVMRVICKFQYKICTIEYVSHLNGKWWSYKKRVFSSNFFNHMSDWNFSDVAVLVPKIFLLACMNREF